MPIHAHMFGSLDQPVPGTEQSPGLWSSPSDPVESDFLLLASNALMAPPETSHLGLQGLETVAYLLLRVWGWWLMSLAFLSSGPFCQPQSKTARPNPQHHPAPLPSKACLELVTWKARSMALLMSRLLRAVRLYQPPMGKLQAGQCALTL